MGSYSVSNYAMLQMDERQDTSFGLTQYLAHNIDEQYGNIQNKTDVSMAFGEKHILFKSYERDNSLKVLR